MSARPAEPRDRGASSIELALLTPVLIFVLLAVVQFAMVYHARHVALAAAQAGARVARTDPGSGWEAHARARAERDARHVGPNLIDGLGVRSGQVGSERFVEVSGTAIRVIPFMTFRVSQRSQGPIECFRPDVGSGTTCEGLG